MEKIIDLDYLIIAVKNLIISFSKFISNKTQKALLLVNQPETIQQFISWFNAYALFEAMSIKSFQKAIFKVLLFNEMQ